jgi:hypothetical protein
MRVFVWQASVVCLYSSEPTAADVGKSKARCRLKSGESLSQASTQDALIQQNVMDDAGICMCCFASRRVLVDALIGETTRPGDAAINVWIFDQSGVLMESVMRELSINSLFAEPTGTRLLASALVQHMSTQRVPTTCPFYSLLLPGTLQPSAVETKLGVLFERLRLNPTQERKSVFGDMPPLSPDDTLAINDMDAFVTGSRTDKTPKGDAPRKVASVLAANEPSRRGDADAPQKGGGFTEWARKKRRVE